MRAVVGTSAKESAIVPAAKRLGVNAFLVPWVALLWAGAVRATPLYEIIDLGTLGGTESYAAGINNAGQVVGYSQITGNGAVHGFLSDGTTLTDLGTLGGTSSYANGINDAGQIVGYSQITGSSAFHAFRSNGTTLTDLGTLGEPQSWGFGINNAGQVVGYSNLTPTTYRAFRSNGTTMTNLGTLGGDYSEAHAINDAGQIVGVADTGSATHAFLSNGTTMTDLGTLGGAFSYAYGINDTGQVVGYSYVTGNRAYHAFLFDGTTMTDLGTLGGSYSEAYDINDLGQIVGDADTGSATHAFLSDGTTMYDLNDLIDPSSPLALYVTVTGARAINDAGWIAASGSSSLTGSTHAYLLTPTNVVPLPAGVWLLLSGLGALFAFERRRGKADILLGTSGSAKPRDGRPFAPAPQPFGTVLPVSRTSRTGRTSIEP